jgi:hypothetical protein
MNEPDTGPRRVRQSRGFRIWIGVLIGVVIALMVPSYLLLRWALSSGWAPQAPNGQATVAQEAVTQETSLVVASYQADFLPNEPKAGWHYYWNDNGPIGNTNGYVELHWDGNHYAVPSPVPPAARYVRLSNRSGHPGRGPGQNLQDDNEHAIVIAFTVSDAGRYALRDSFILRHDGPTGGAVHLRVFVNDREIATDLYCQTREKMSFDRELGKLAAGDRIYVCIGPGETDLNDSFSVDFAFGRF